VRGLELSRAKTGTEVIHYLGPRRLEDLVTEIERCDLGVIPNRWNAFTEINTPTRIFEYLAVGKPVIAPSTRGIRDYFGEDSLFFFEPGNHLSLARQIEYVFSHPGQALEVVQNGQKVYLEHTWERERETLLGRVSQILSTRSPI
jgi:glycosyltransferase involved in cell wall biosynthesis